MPLNEICRKQVIDTISSRYPTEIQYYTHPKVQTTSHAVGDPDKASWTNELLDNKVIHTRPVTGDRFIEVERTATALYNCLLMNLEFKDSYDAFSACQRNNPEIASDEIISKDSFKKIYNKTNSILNNDSDKQAVLMDLIIYSDIGKSPRFKELVEESCKKVGIYIDLTLDPDDLMKEILTTFSDEQIIEILPSFSKLSEQAKKMLRTVYPIMQACFGHLYFLERGQKTLDIIGNALLKIPKEMRKEALDLVYLAQFFDGAGAQGQRKITGSLTCTNSFAMGYELMHVTLEKMRINLEKTNNVNEASRNAFDYYLEERAKWLGFAKPASPEQQFLTRLGCTLRGFTPEIGALLVEEYKEIKNPVHKKLLNERLSFSGKGFEGWKKRVNYRATPAQNISRDAFAKHATRQAIQAAFNAEICFAMLVKEMTEKFPEIVYDDKGAISFGEIAFLATKNPEIFNPNTFNASEFIIDPKMNKIIQLPVIKNDSFFTREFIDGFLQHYTPEEKIKIAKDLKNIKEYTFDEAISVSESNEQPIYVATAGGSGAGKTTVLETFKEENNLKHFIYADPDQVSLKNMNYTYRKSLSNYHFAEAKSNHDALQKAYNQWRPASNYICHEMLQIAFGAENNKDTQFSILHGTASTNPAVEQLYKKIKLRNYNIHLLLCYSPDHIRKEAIEKREKEQAFVQVDAKEVISKGQDFPKRFDIYFAYADKIAFYWNDKLEHGRLPVSCATLIKLPNHSTVLTVTDPVGWEFFCKKYLADCEKYQIKMCDDFKSLIPKKILEKSEKIYPHVIHGFYGALSKSQSDSIENIEIREAEKIFRVFS
jgi:hypothetical protein